MEDKTIVQIDGALRSEFVEELVRAVSEVEPPITLDLSNLRTMDSASADAFAKMAKDMAEVIGVSQFIRLLLEKHGLELEE